MGIIGLYAISISLRFGARRLANFRVGAGELKLGEGVVLRAKMVPFEIIISVSY